MCTVQAAADRTERAAPHLTKPNRRAPCAVGQLKPLLKGPPAASLPPGSQHPCTAPQHSTGPGSLAESHQGALPAASGLDSPLVAANNLCFTALGSAQRTSTGFICCYQGFVNIITLQFMGNEATGSPRSRVASRASPQQFLTKGFKDQAKAEESGEVYEVLTVKKRLEATHA